MTAPNPAPHRFAGRVPAGVEPVVPGPGQESVWDYPRPPRMETVGDRIRVVVGGEVIADSDRALRVLETAGAPVYYVPRDDVRTELLSPTLRSTHLRVEGRRELLDRHGRWPGRRERRLVVRDADAELRADHRPSRVLRAADR